MAKLPSELDLGGIGSFESNRPIANVNTNGIAEGAAALGKGIQSFGLHMLDAERANERLEVARAKADFLTSKLDLDDKYRDDPKYQDLPDRYGDDLTKARNAAGSLISNPRARQRFEIESQPTFARGVSGIRNQAFKTESDIIIADVNGKLENIRQRALKATDPADRDESIQTGNDLITDLERRGFISAQTGQKTRSKWVTDYAIGAISIMPPAERLSALQGKPTTDDQLVDRIVGNESGGNANAKNPLSSATGAGQFINSTWLDLIKRNRPDIAEGRSDAQILALRGDKGLSREMVGQYAKENSAFLQSKGIEATPGNVYLAHFLGPDKAARVLSADPSTPVIDIVGPEAVRANPGILGGRLAGSVAAWADKKMGGDSRLAQLIPEDKRVQMTQKAQTEVLQQERERASAASASIYQTKTRVGDDVGSMLATGRGLPDISADEVRTQLGDKAVIEWQEKRDDAHAVWAASHDLSTLSDSDIDKRLAMVEPKAGEEGFIRQNKVFTEVAKRANEVREQRAVDPAGSVIDDPTVKQASEAAANGNPVAVKNLVVARLAAQERAGIPQDLRSPITKDEALGLMAPLSRALPGTERDTLKQIAQTAKERYGEYAEDALTYALRAQKMDKDTALVAARIVRKIAAGSVPDRQDARAVDGTKEVAAADQAVNGVAPPPAGDESMGSTYDPSKGREASLPMIPARAIVALRANPALASQFDQQYGNGQAEKILKAYPLRPKPPATVAERN